MLRSRRRLGLAIVALTCALPAVPAHAAQIEGDVLVISSDDQGRLGVAYRDAQRTEFCCASVAEDGSVPSNNAGFDVTVLRPDGGTDRFGARAGNVTVTSPPGVTGTGTAGDPFKLTTVWQGSDANGPLVEIKQELSYVQGAQEFRASYSVRNLSPQVRVSMRASMGADLAGGGSDSGSGLFDGGPPRFVGGFNTGVGSVAGLSELTPWSHYEEGLYFDVLGRASGDPRDGTNLLDTVEPNQVDNGTAVQWDDRVGNALSPGETATFDVNWRFLRTFALTPQKVEATTGDPIDFQVALGGTNGAPAAGVPIRFTSGFSGETGSVKTDKDGNATFQVVGSNPGTETVSAYADLNGNGVARRGRAAARGRADARRPGRPRVRRGGQPEAGRGPGADQAPARRERPGQVGPCRPVALRAPDDGDPGPDRVRARHHEGPRAAHLLEGHDARPPDRAVLLRPLHGEAVDERPRPDRHHDEPADQVPAEPARQGRPGRIPLAQAVGPRQGPLPHPRAQLVGDGARHGLADEGHLHDDDHDRPRGRGRGEGLRQAQERAREGRRSATWRGPGAAEARAAS